MATREIEHATETEATSDDLLANLDEQQKQQVQMQQIREATVKDGLLKIPVKSVTTAENSEQYAVEPDHPVLDSKELRSYYEKPLHGWTREYDIVKLLDWYCGGSDNPYDLQLHHVYCQYDKEEDEWEIVKPPSYTKSGTNRLQSMIVTVLRGIASRRPSRTNAAMFGFMLTGLIAGSVGAIAAPATVAASATILAPLLGFLTMTILGMAVLEP